MEESVFTKIINGAIPCHKIYEDDQTIAFLDIHPVQPGMVLVVPKVQIANFYELGDSDYDALWQSVKLVAARLAAVYPHKKRIAVQVEGLDVPHVHVKIFPVSTGSEFHARPDTNAEPDQQALAVEAERIRF